MRSPADAMADSPLPYTMYAKRERRVDGEGAVLLDAERWELLSHHFAGLQRETGLAQPLVEIKLDLPIFVHGVAFLPAVYRPA